MMSISNGTGVSVNDYTYVRVCVSAVAFIILALFNLVINWTVVREERLRNHARFVLVFHLLFSALVYFAVNFAFYLQIQLDVGTAASACMALITVLITSASNILLTLTVMALDRYWAICHPLRYNCVRLKHWPWFIGILTWALASIIPLSLFTNSEEVTVHGERCDREQLKKGELHKILLISICTAVILYSYVRILCEGRRLGVLNRHNRVGCRTIAWHGAQLAVYILPNFINFVLHVLRKHGHLDGGAKDLFAVINFAFFSSAQCVAPIVYGLRKEELLEQLSNRFPCLSCHLKSLLEWTVRVTQPQRRPRERRMTTQTLLSLEASQTTV